MKDFKKLNLIFLHVKSLIMKKNCYVGEISIETPGYEDFTIHIYEAGIGVRNEENDLGNYDKVWYFENNNFEQIYDKMVEFLEMKEVIV